MEFLCKQSLLLVKLFLYLLRHPCNLSRLVRSIQTQIEQNQTVDRFIEPSNKARNNQQLVFRQTVCRKDTSYTEVPGIAISGVSCKCNYSPHPGIVKYLSLLYSGVVGMIIKAEADVFVFLRSGLSLELSFDVYPLYLQYMTKSFEYKCDLGGRKSDCKSMYNGLTQSTILNSYSLLRYRLQ